MRPMVAILTLFLSLTSYPSKGLALSHFADQSIANLGPSVILIAKAKGRSGAVRAQSAKPPKAVKGPARTTKAKVKPAPSQHSKSIMKPASAKSTTARPSQNVQHGPKSADAMAKGVAKKVNKNSVVIKTSPQKGNPTSIRYDLRSTRQSGKSHYNKSLKKDVPTPHKVKEVVHVNKNPKTGQIYKNGRTSEPVAMTKSDVRTVQKYLTRKSKK